MRTSRRARVSIQCALVFLLSHGIAEAGPGGLSGVMPSLVANVPVLEQDARARHLMVSIVPEPAHPRRPALLVPLYGVFAGLQIADAHSTLAAVSGGSIEANPVMAGVARSPAALIAVKLTTTSGTIFVTELLWRRNRRAAIVTAIALNIGYAAIVAHNYRTVQ